jgi:hypothetical protein
MENQEEEYQCPECGITVTADVKICPNCGANLDEALGEVYPREEKFVDIPLTSDPAILSAILSLLDEMKIEYAINENPMENIWGPTFSQVPRLLIRADLEDEVNEIIESVDEDENYQILDTEIIDAEYKVGAYFSIKSEESGYKVVKILATDLQGVHIRMYSNHFIERPESINLGDLYSNSIKDDSKTLGVYHIPIIYETFSEKWQPEFILQGEVTEDDLVGYNIWKEEKGGYF